MPLTVFLSSFHIEMPNYSLTRGMMHELYGLQVCLCIMRVSPSPFVPLSLIGVLLKASEVLDVEILCKLEIAACNGFCYCDCFISNLKVKDLNLF